MIGGIVYTAGLVLIVVTVVSAERRSKRRTRELCDRADHQIQTLQHNASVRSRERVGVEPKLSESAPPGG
jgi:hypothetical protein